MSVEYIPGVNAKRKIKMAATPPYSAKWDDAAKRGLLHWSTAAWHSVKLTSFKPKETGWLCHLHPE